MLVREEIRLKDFNFWAGGHDTAFLLQNATFGEPAFDDLEALFEELYPDGMTPTQINDIFWFENDWIAEQFGFDSWDELCESERASGNAYFL